MGHVFISYANEDRSKVSGLAAALERRGLTVWFDAQLVAGDHFDLVIESALATSDHVIVAWSPSACASRWVRAEAAEGLDRQILVPVVIEPTTIPLEFRRIHTLDLTKWDGIALSGQFERLVGALSPAGQTDPVAVRAAAFGASAAGHEEQPENHAEAHAYAVKSSKYWGANFRFRLRKGSKNIGIRYVDFGIGHWLSVDGKRVSPISYMSHPEYYTFSIDTENSSSNCELTLVTEGYMWINKIIFSVDGREVLHHVVRWRDGATSAVIISLMSLIMFLAIASLLLGR